MYKYICSACGYEVSLNEDVRVGQCPACGALFIVPVQFELTQNLYLNAATARFAGDDEVAQNFYQRILKWDGTQTEANWGFLLSKYGVIESQKNHATGQVYFRRIQHSSFLEDPAYAKMMEYCPQNCAYDYESRARRIDERHRKMLDLSAETRNFDIYLDCVSPPGTLDYALSESLLTALEAEGYSVFLPAVHLEAVPEADRNLHEIAHAEKAKSMIVVFTPETDMRDLHFDIVWKRFLQYRKNDGSRKQFSVYQNLRSRELPMELQPFEAFKCDTDTDIADLIARINGMFGRTQTTELNRRIQQNYESAEEYLRKGDWKQAEETYNDILAIDTTQHAAYFGVVKARTQNLSRVDLSDTTISHLRLALEHAPDYEHNLYLTDARELLTEPAWQKLLSSSADLSDYDAESTAEVRSDIGAVRLLMPHLDPRQMNLERYRRIAEYHRKVGQLRGFFDARDPETRPLFREYADHNQKISALKQKMPDIRRSRLMELLSALSTALLLAALVTFIWHFKYALGNEGHIYRSAHLLYLAGVFCMLASLVLLRCKKTAVGLGLSAVGTFAINLMIGSHPTAWYLYMVPASAVVFILCRMQTQRQGFVIGSVYRERSELLKEKSAIEARFRDAFADETRALAADYDCRPGQETVYDMRPELLDLKTGWPQKINILVQIGLSILYLAAALAIATFVSNQLYAGPWKQVVQLVGDNNHIVGLREDGTVIGNGYGNGGALDVSDWKNITYIVSGSGNDNIASFTAGLCADGTVNVATRPDSPVQEAENWTDIAAISASQTHLVGLKRDGTCVAVGLNDYHQLEVEAYTDVVDMRAMVTRFGIITWLLTSDGQVHVTPADQAKSLAEYLAAHTGSGESRLPVSRVLFSESGFLLFSDDGRYLLNGLDDNKQLSMIRGQDVSTVEDFFTDMFALARKRDGTLLFGGMDVGMQKQVEGIDNAVSMAGSFAHVIVALADGQCIGIGVNEDGQCDVSDWKDIVQVEATRHNSFGIDTHGNVYATGYKNGGMCYTRNKNPFEVMEFWYSILEW